MLATPALMRYGANYVGRDFVIGDLHGMYELFEKLLKHIDFDPTVDRMFSVGDLVDRGPDSMRCAELLYETWFHAVTSNHEQMMIRAVLHDDAFWRENWYYNGGMWATQVEKILLFDVARLAATRPYLITLQKKDQSIVHIVHAELPPGRKLTDADLADENQVRLLSTIGPFYGVDIRNRETKIQRAASINSASFPIGDNLSLVISGHTPVQAPLHIKGAGGGQLNIDTGAFMSGDRKWAGLTCMNIETGELVQARESGVANLKPVVINIGPDQRTDNEAG
jgi:serine/threonine protein phosphatase 1